MERESFASAFFIFGSSTVRIPSSTLPTSIRTTSADRNISSSRSTLGAYQNRLETASASVNAYNENITSALSRIEDCDMAEEMTTYTSQNVISQAATSILSQANEMPQTVLELLQ